jgi:hypothetical protein
MQTIFVGFCDGNAKAVMKNKVNCLTITTHENGIQLCKQQAARHKITHS